MNQTDLFSTERRATIREEILTAGLLADPFLGPAADAPTFGFNLACCWPFPEGWREPYAAWAARVGEGNPWVYVYPLACTHITLVTFVSFSRGLRLAPQEAVARAGLMERVKTIIEPLFESASPESVRAFELVPQPPVLGRAAGFMPLTNPDGEVQRLRETVRVRLQTAPALYRELTEWGLNFPGIIHSTLLRYRATPPDWDGFLKQFDAATADLKLPTIKVSEVLLTTETKPYMRAGDCFGQFKLSAE